LSQEPPVFNKPPSPLGTFVRRLLLGITPLLMLVAVAAPLWLIDTDAMRAEPAPPPSLVAWLAVRDADDHAGVVERDRLEETLRFPRDGSRSWVAVADADGNCWTADLRADRPVPFVGPASRCAR
jgi:hypothetical protein